MDLKTIPKLEKLKLIVFDFDGVITNNKVLSDGVGNEYVVSSRSDSLGLKILKQLIKEKRLAVRLMILSTESNPVVKSRATKLGLDCYSGIRNKKDFIESYSREQNLKQKEILFLGNDLNDLCVIPVVGFTIAPSDAHEIVKSNFDMVLDKKGGNGFVRKVVEEVAALQTMSKDTIINLLTK